jgi:hypothetical protein
MASLCPLGVRVERRRCRTEAQNQKRAERGLGGSHYLQQVMRVRPDSRDLMLAQILEPDGDDVDSMSIAGEFAAGIEQRLLNLVIGRKPDFEIEVEVASPEENDWF